ncbi:type I-E CRISPR-associated protein Cas7/Cse4/CasC [Streptomyces sp. G-G2]|uniref:type I-E CRISPR-associated protein Cas7/Cse4/CasC n=1 Tax=Streptomyces sp. G-G2 TaxID=3046201 RepID=UPI0024BAB717|nr:type I-E CRISPR-associated protein Cas7/Cse4/CasC [Streptomyces sp. G-G2]MDJ0386015.1 type I-E CRISPR-associated protein Cas7/Cse4/CasC [Streptomyces sp. G-G2]
MALTDITADPRLIDTTDHDGNFVVVHILTTYTGVSLNRDFTNLPKIIQFGDAPRMRVSAQSKDRAVRTLFRGYTGETVQDTARSRLLPQQTARQLQALGHPAEEAHVQAALIVASAGMQIDKANTERTRAIAYVPAQAPERLAALATEVWDETAEARAKMGEAIDEAVAKRAKKSTVGKNTDAEADTEEPRGRKGPESAGIEAPKLPQSIVERAAAAFAPGTIAELAIFGRMLAEVPDGTIYSAAQVAHAFSVDPLAMTSDDWTAKDDWQDLGVFGAAGKGTTYLASGTLYQYAALDRRALRATLSKSATPAEAEHLARLGEQLFVTALAYATPSSARSRTGSAASPTLTIAAATDYPFTAAACFESAIEAPAAVSAAERLTTYLRRAQRHTPLAGGICRWLPPAGEDCPALPSVILCEDD